MSSANRLLLLPAAVVVLMTSASFPLLGQTPDRLWNTRIWAADNGLSTSGLWGADVSGSLHESLAGSASFIQGKYNQSGDVEKTEEYLILLGQSRGSWEIGMGFSYLAFDTDLKRGANLSYPEEQQERNDDIYGPAAYLKYLHPVFSSQSGLNATVIAMPYDFGDLDELGYNGRYVEFRGGYYWTGERVRAAAGYQYRRFDDMPPRILNDQSFSRNETRGFTLELGFYF